MMIILVNAAFSFTPTFHLFGFDISPLDPLAGIIYLVRDFAQRELGHYKIFIAMIIGMILSYILANPRVAYASIAAFTIGEMVDWALFTFSKKNLHQRLILSSCISSPLDSFVFLLIINRFNTGSFFLMLLGKILGILFIYQCWKKQKSNKNKLPLSI